MVCSGLAFLLLILGHGTTVTPAQSAYRPSSAYPGQKSGSVERGTKLRQRDAFTGQNGFCVNHRYHDRRVCAFGMEVASLTGALLHSHPMSLKQPSSLDTVSSHTYEYLRITNSGEKSHGKQQLLGIGRRGAESPRTQETRQHLSLIHISEPE